MRISTTQLHQSGVRDMQRINSDLAQTQAQISSGKRIVKPSDDPVGAAKVVSLQSEIAQRETYVKNTHAAETMLEQEESVLVRITDIVQRIQELAIQAGNGVQTPEDRSYLAIEIEARLGELQGLVNSRNADGTFMFAGNRGGIRPFVQEGEKIRYDGDDGQRTLQIDRSLFVPTNDSGRRLFMDVPSTGPNFGVASASGNAGTGTVRASAVKDEEALAELVPETLIIEFRPLSEAGGFTNYTVRRQSDQRAVTGMENVIYNPGDAIRVAGMEMTLSGQPIEGDGFIVTTGNTAGLLETVSSFATGLRSLAPETQPEAFRKLLDDTLGNLVNAGDTILQVQSDIGARLNTLTATRSFHEEQNLAAEALISEVRDVDYAEAVSRLSFQTFVLEAAQQSFVRVSRLSLFNSI